MSDCTICGKEKPGFIMDNKAVCLRCDELMFDLEIELDEAETKKHERPRIQEKEAQAKPSLRAKRSNPVE